MLTTCHLLQIIAAAYGGTPVDATSTLNLLNEQ